MADQHLVQKARVREFRHTYDTFELLFKPEFSAVAHGTPCRPKNEARTRSSYLRCRLANAPTSPPGRGGLRNPGRPLVPTSVAAAAAASHTLASAITAEMSRPRKRVTSLWDEEGEEEGATGCSRSSSSPLVILIRNQDDAGGSTFSQLYSTGLSERKVAKLRESSA